MHAPFDGITVTCAPDHVPPALVEQLTTGGHRVIPVGSERAIQWLEVVTKNEDGSMEAERIDAVRFVPMTGEAETRSDDRP